MVFVEQPLDLPGSAKGNHPKKNCFILDTFQIVGRQGVQPESKSLWVLLFSHIWASFWTISGGKGAAEPISKVVGYLKRKKKYFGGVLR